MRPIKFLGRDDDGKWVDVTLDFILSEEGSSIYQMFHGPYRQFTGLHDKNGKEIYEGDIIKMYDVEFEGENPVDLLGEVKWDDEWTGWIVKIPRQYEWMGSKFFEWCLPMTYKQELIGNIYDNPELMEKCKC